MSPPQAMEVDDTGDEDASLASQSTLLLSLHDCLSLGEVELGLANSRSTSDSKADETTNRASSANTVSTSSTEHDEIKRLPVLLRLLSKMRPLASLDNFEASSTSSTKSQGEGDGLVNRTVERLEHVAATHSVAEGVDVVTCHLVPTMTKKLSKVPSLKKHSRYDGDPSSSLVVSWDTKELSDVARNPRSSNRRKRKSEPERDGSTATGGNEGSIAGGDDGPENETEDSDAKEDEPASKRRKSTLKRRDSMEVAAEDSQEATVAKTLSELASLVVSSLEPIVEQQPTDAEDDAGPQHTSQQEEPGSQHEQQQPGQAQQRQRGKGQVALSIDDSMLSESGSAGSTGGAVEGSDLGSTVASLMHHAPVLLSRHVANAVCRASIPQAGELMSRMGANSPASVPSLLLGCVQAYLLAMEHKQSTIANVSKQGILALAQLSKRERGRVQNKLQSLGIMWDVQLRLAMDADRETTESSVMASLILIQQLSPRARVLGSPPGTAVNGSKAVPTSTRRLSRESTNEEQASGDAPTDFREHEIEEGTELPTHYTEVTLHRQLYDQPDLYHSVLSFYNNAFAAVSTTLESIPQGQLTLMLKAYCWILLVPSKNTSEIGGLKSRTLKHLVHAVQALVKGTSIDQPSAGIPQNSRLDGFLMVLHCAALLTVSRCLQCDGGADEAVSSEPSYHKLAESTQGWSAVSQRLNGFQTVVDSVVSKGHVKVLHQHIMKTLCVITEAHDLPQVCKSDFLDIESGLQRACGLWKTEISTSVKDGETRDIISTLLHRRMEIQAGVSGVDSRVLETLRWVLTDENVLLEHLVKDDVVARFVVEATKRLASSETMMLEPPVVSTLSLETLASKTPFSPGKTARAPNEPESRFLLQLLHLFEHLDDKPKSPFAFDPRQLPVQQALVLSVNLPKSPRDHFLHERLMELVCKHCPDTLLKYQRAECQVWEHQLASLFEGMSRRRIMDSVFTTIRSRIETLQPDDDAPDAESIFLSAKSNLSSDDLHVTVLSALLAVPHEPPPAFTYRLLCRDPLVVFKCSMKIWRCKGLRRVCLSLLTSLLESNTAIVYTASPMEITAEALLAARDTMVVRCLLTCTCGVNSHTPLACSMTRNVIRSLVCGHPGLVASLIKQGLSEHALDWLVENVPETFNDSQELFLLLTDQSSLAPAERLVAADAALRIAIVHGQGNESEAANLAFAALQQLVDSFFLVVGPVGVPVNSLIVDDSGVDVTQISRKAAFRILKSLLGVRGRRVRLRKECGMALQKLASLCKSESPFSGLAGAVAGKRKALLKELYDAITRAATAIGSTIFSQSTAA